MTIFLGIVGVFIVIIVFGVPMAIYADRQKQKKIEKAFDGRQGLDEREFYERYFQERDIPFYIIQKVRQILEEELNADLSQLSANDDFSKELSFFWEYDSYADVEILLRIEEEFDIKIKDSEAVNRTNTVEKIVNLVWDQVQQKEN